MARDLSKRMRGLGAAEMLPVWEGDVDGGDLEEAFDTWSAKTVKALKDGVVENGGALSNGFGAEGDAESDYETDEEYSVESEIVDLEDIAGKGPSRRSPVVVQTNGTSNGKKDMVTPVIRASLEKQVLFIYPFAGITFYIESYFDILIGYFAMTLNVQGYKIIGSHSGVKVCRWTKSQLRGRGGCYKHSFYGIESHR